MEMQNFKTSPNMTQNHHTEALWRKALKRNQINTGYIADGTFVEDLPDFIRNRVRLYCSSNKAARLHDLA